MHKLSIFCFSLIYFAIDKLPVTATGINDCTSDCSKVASQNILQKVDLRNKLGNVELRKTEGRLRPRRQLPATKVLDDLLGERIFNTTMNFIVPGAHMYMHSHTEDGSIDHLAMQAYFGLFFAIAWISTIAIPTVVTYLEPLGIARSFQGSNILSENKVRWMLNDKIADKIGLHWTSCLEKTVCQAHTHAQKYGVLGAVVRMLYPAQYHGNDASSDSHKRSLPLEDHENHDWFNNELNEQVDTCNQTHKCFFDVLDVLLFLKNHFNL